MSISSEISRINGNVANAYSALSTKGAVMPSVRNTANLAAAIESIELMTAEAMSIETIRAICYTPIVLTGIAIASAPTKTDYVAGETFDPSGMIITASYSKGVGKVITDYTCSPSGALTTETTVITISYIENGVTVTATQAIIVSEPKISLTVGGSMSSSYAYATVAGTKIYTDTTMEIAQTDSVKVYVGAKATNAQSNCYVNLNGTKVKSGAGTYIVNTTGCQTIKIVFSTLTGARGQYYYCNVITT